MGRLIDSTYLSLDGIVQNPQNFTFEYRSDDATRYAHDLLFSADALLMGRHTYEGFAAYWPTAKDDDGSADRMNALPRYVISDTLTDSSWANTHVVPRAQARDTVIRLKRELGTVIQYGFGAVTADLLDAGLVDVVHLWLHPLFAGSNDAADLITHARSAARFELIDVTRCTSVLLIVSYRPTNTVADA